MKVAIYGAGAMGTVLGAFLMRSGEKVDLITRNKAHVKALNQKGAHIVGSVDMRQDVHALLPSEMKTKYDIIFLMTKQLNNKEVVTYLKDYLSEDGVICSMQNGLPELLISEIIGEENVFGCTMNWSAFMEGSGVVHLASKNTPKTLSFGLGSFHQEKRVHLEEIKRLLSQMGDVTLEENFMGVKWSKLLINSSFNGLSAILGYTLGEIAANKTSRRVFQCLVKECIDVAKENQIKIAKVQGVDIVKLLDYQTKLKQKFSFMLIPLLLRKHSASKSSTYQDIEAGRKTEIEAINGIITHYGEKAGVDTPFNEKVIQLVKQLKNGQLKPDFENVKYFQDLL